MSITEPLTEELEVVNAIFGEGTCQVISATALKTRILLKLPAAQFDSHKLEWTGKTEDDLTGSCKRTTIGSTITFSADFFAAYPQVMPQVIGVEKVSLYEYYEQGMWKVHLALVILLNEVFTPGEVCIYDWFLQCYPGIRCLGREGLDLAKYAKLTSDLDFNMSRWRWASHQKPMNLEKALLRNEYTICLDMHIMYEMIDMICGDIFCNDCFREGWNLAQKAKEPFTCYNRRIPQDTIRVYVEIDDAQAKRYERLLVERDTPHPIYCSRPQCSGFLGGMSEIILRRGLIVKCPECAVSTCVVCQNLAHGGDCMTGELENMMKQFGIQRCPRCVQATVKNGGCDHMKCRTCGMDYWWTP